MTTTELLITASLMVMAFWLTSIIVFFILLAIDMLKEQDKDY